MNCICCGQEMQKGQVSFMAMQGFGQMLASFVTEEEQQKNCFTRKSTDAILLSGTEVEAYYCPACHKMVPVIDV